MASIVNVINPILSTKNLVTKFKTQKFDICLASRQHYTIKKDSTMTMMTMNKYGLRKLDLMVSSCLDSSTSRSNRMSGYDIVMKFYSSINEKNRNRLSSCISTDCYIEDFSFSKPFRGKNEAMNFFEELVKSMGQNVKFCVENVCEGEYNAAVNWHLEWKGRKIPFTRGCSFYEFTEQGGILIIRNAKILIESPIKPGGIVLSLLKNITFLFDEFPKAAEWFLEKPYAIIQIILKVYGLTLGPFVNHIASTYLKLLNTMVEVFLLIFKIVIKIQNLFFK